MNKNQTVNKNAPKASTIGEVLSSLRIEKEMERAFVAKKLKIKPNYLGQIERDDPVAISPRLVAGLEKIYKKSLKKFSSMVVGHNYFVNRYRRDKAKIRKNKLK